MLNIINYIIKNSIYIISNKTFFKFLLSRYKNESIVYCLHRVLPSKKRRLENIKNLDFIITTKYFENFIKKTKKDYEFVDLKTISRKINSNKKKKYCHLTFDDGYLDNLQYAFPILKKYNVPATFYISDSYIDRSKNIKDFLCANNINDFMNWNELKKLSKSKLVTIGCHTSNHKELSKLSNKDVHKEIFFSKKNIEKKLKKKIYDFAYPYGGKDNFNENTTKIVRKLKFKTAVTAMCNTWNIKNSQFLIPRYFVTEKCSDLILKSRISGLSNFLKNQFLP